MCFLYLSNRSRHAQTPTVCCQRQRFEERRREEPRIWLRIHCAINAPKAGRSGEETVHAAFLLPNETEDQTAQLCAVAVKGAPRL